MQKQETDRNQWISLPPAAADRTVQGGRQQSIAAVLPPKRRWWCSAGASQSECGRGKRRERYTRGSAKIADQFKGLRPCTLLLPLLLLRSCDGGSNNQSKWPSVQSLLAINYLILSSGTSIHWSDGTAVRLDVSRNPVPRTGESSITRQRLLPPHLPFSLLRLLCWRGRQAEAGRSRNR